MNRRELLSLAVASTGGLFLPRVGFAKELIPDTTVDMKELFLKAGSDQLTFAAKYKIPPALLTPSNYDTTGESYVPLHMEDLYKALRTKRPSAAQLSSFDGSDMPVLPISGGRENYFQYLQGVMEASRRGEQVTFVLEMPVDNNRDLREWEQYLRFVVAQLPNTGRVQIGNEMIGSSIVGGNDKLGFARRYNGNWEKYGALFAQAYQIIRNRKPNLAIGASAPLYLGEQDTSLGSQLEAIKKATSEIKLDFLPLHFYDEANKLETYVNSQQRILHTVGFDCPIVLSEYGTKENRNFHPDASKRLQQARSMFFLTGEVMRLINSSQIESACAYTAYSASEPIFSMLAKDKEGHLRPTLTWYAFVLAGNVFNGIQIVGTNQRGERVTQIHQPNRMFEVTQVGRERDFYSSESFVHFGDKINITQLAKVQRGDIVVTSRAKQGQRHMGF